MALPAQYNISYYRGDTYTIWVVPKDQSGNPIDLTGYASKFTAADKRGPLEAGNESFDLVADNPANGKIRCEIPPAIGKLFNPDKSYFYDIQVNHPTPGEVYTYLTGTISITADVSDA